MLVAAALASGSIAFAGTIRGRVTEAAKPEGLPYASVFLSGKTREGVELRTGQATDLEGRFVFAELPDGTFTLRVLYMGYEERQETVTLAPGDTVDLDIELVVRPIEVKAIVVKGDRLEDERDIQTGVVSLDAATVANTPGIIEADPLRTLQLLPGVKAVSDVSSGLYVRGGGPDQTLVMLDDVPVYNPTHALGFFSTFNADAVGDVTLYKGAYPAQHGGRLGAVLDVTGREPSVPRLSGMGGVSTIAARVTAEGPIGENHWLVSARRTYLDPFLDAIRTEENPLPSYYFYDVNAKFITKRDTDWWVASAYRGRDDVGFDLGEDGKFDVRWGNTILSASYNRFLGKSVIGKLQLSGNEYGGDTGGEVFGTTFAFDNRLRELSVRGDLDWTGSDRHRLRGGLQWSLYDFGFEQSFNAVDAFVYEASPYEVSVYADEQWKPVTGTALRAGLRTRYLSDGGRTLFEPRFSASQVVSGNVRLKLGAGIYHQYVQLVATEGFSFADFYVPIDETADPGRSWQLVLGAEWEPVQRYRFSAEGYYTGLEDLVQLDNTTASDEESYAAENIFYTGGTGYATGIELFAERRTGSLTGWVGYTLGWTERRFEEINGGEEFPPKYDRRHDINVVANYDRGKWTYGAVFVYGTGQPFTPAAARFGLRDPAGDFIPRDRLLPADKNSARLLAYHRLDVSVARDFKLFGLDAEWFVQVFNLYSRRNEWFVQFGEDAGQVEVDVVKMLPIVPSIGVNFQF